MKKIFIILSFFVALCSSSVVAFSADKVPKILRFKVGYGDQWNEKIIEMKNGKLFIVAHKNHDERRPTVSKRALNSPSPEKWLRFRKKLDELKIWRWEKDGYANSVYLTKPGQEEIVSDPWRIWDVVISYKDRSLKTSGTDAYPRANAKSSDKLTGHFKTFLKAVEDLTGEKFPL